MVVPYTQLSSTASQPRFSSAGQKAAKQALQQRGPQFGDRHAISAEHAQTSPKRSWLKTLLLGAGTLIGIAFAGNMPAVQSPSISPPHWAKKWFGISAAVQ